MKKIYFISAILLIVMVECIEQRQAVNDDIIKVDVTKSYSPKKELFLQDFMDVEYIALETNDNFINQGIVLDVGKEFILVKNNILLDGDIFVYDRTGKAIRKINNRGQGPGEYMNIKGIVLDEINNEMFVNNSFRRNIMVYDLLGNYKRSFKQPEEEGNPSYIDIYNFDDDNLICYDEFNEERVFVLISKQDGSITKKFKIPFNEKKIFQYMKDGQSSRPAIPTRTITTYNGNWILSDLSSDTIYTLLPDYSLRPFIVRTPRIQSMNPEVFLLLRILSDRYYFMETVRNEFDFDAVTGFPSKFMMYDKQEKAFLGYSVYNGDYSIKKEIYMNRLIPINNDIDSRQTIQAYELIEAYRNGQLKNGKLKEIASKLVEDDNPVIMLVKHKK